MKKRILKIFFILIFILIYLGMFFPNVIVKAIPDLIENPLENPPAADSKLLEMANPILSIIQIAAIGIAIALIINDGIKLLTEPDPGVRANLKRKIAYYFIGGIFIFIPATIIKILASTTEKIKI